MVTPVVSRAQLKIALGLAVPCIEGWYLFGRNSQVGEAIWIAGMQSRKPPYTRNGLKKEVYGNEAADIEEETVCAQREATRLIYNLETLEKFFPHGFGSLAKEVRSWI